MTGTVTVPRAGVYVVRFTGRRTGSNSTAYFKFKHGAADSAQIDMGTPDNGFVGWSEEVTCAASEVIQAWGRSDSGFTASGYAFMEITPVTVT
jgi:hypothetical protein